MRIPTFLLLSPRKQSEVIVSSSLATGGCGWVFLSTLHVVSLLTLAGKYLPSSYSKYVENVLLSPHYFPHKISYCCSQCSLRKGVKFGILWAETSGTKKPKRRGWQQPRCGDGGSCPTKHTHPAYPHFLGALRYGGCGSTEHPHVCPAPRDPPPPNSCASFHSKLEKFLWLILPYVFLVNLFHEV